MKKQRDLSGVFFRQQNTTTMKWENVCFEDCEEEKQNEILETKDIEFIRSLCKSLAKTINEIAEMTGITSNLGD